MAHPAAAPVASAPRLLCAAPAHRQPALWVLPRPAPDVCHSLEANLAHPTPALTPRQRLRAPPIRSHGRAHAGARSGGGLPCRRSSACFSCGHGHAAAACRASPGAPASGSTGGSTAASTSTTPCASTSACHCAVDHACHALHQPPPRRHPRHYPLSLLRVRPAAFTSPLARTTTRAGARGTCAGGRTVASVGAGAGASACSSTSAATAVSAATPSRHCRLHRVCAAARSAVPALPSRPVSAPIPAPRPLSGAEQRPRLRR